MTQAKLPRRFAVLGQNRGAPNEFDVWRSLLRKSDAHEIVARAMSGSDETSTHADWRSLLVDDSIEAVLLASDAPDVLVAARELAARGMPLAIPITATLPPEFVTELSLYDAEGESTLIPLVMARYSPLLRDLRQRISRGEMGNLSSIESEREVTRENPTLVDIDAIASRRMGDVDTLRMLGGDYAQVTLLRTLSGERPTSETLKLGGSGLADAISSVRIATGEPTWHLRVVGSTATALIRPTPQGQVLEVDGEEVNRLDSDKAHVSRQLEMLNEAFCQDPGAPRWRDVVRTFEICEAAERSLRRRRTIDLHFETASERSQFKTQMAAIGCGVILWTMFGVIGLLFAGAVLDPRDRSQQQAEAAGFVIAADAFDNATGALMPAGEDHVHRIAKNLALSESVVIIETANATASTDEASRNSLDERRRQAVEKSLRESGAGDIDQRVVIRPLKGKWFARVMLWGRAVVFGPVGLFLLLQLLLVIAKPPVRTTTSTTSATHGD